MRRDLTTYQLAQFAGVGGHVEHRDLRPRNGAREFLNDDVADLIADLVHGEFAIGADDLGQELGWLRNFHRIRPKGAQAHGTKFGVAHDDRIFRAPLQVVEPCSVDEIHFGFEWAFETMIPVLQRRHDRHVVGFKHVETRCEHIGQLPLVHEHCRLSFAHRQLGTVLDLMTLTLKPPDHRVTGVVDPMDDVDEFA